MRHKHQGHHLSYSIPEHSCQATITMAKLFFPRKSRKTYKKESQQFSFSTVVIQDWMIFNGNHNKEFFHFLSRGKDC